MPDQASDSHKGKKTHAPKRGHIKARILSTLLRSVAAMAGGKLAGGRPEGEVSASTAAPPAVAKQRPTGPTFFLSSTGSLEGFLVEVPKQVVLRRCPALEPPPPRQRRD